MYSYKEKIIFNKIVNQLNKNAHKNNPKIDFTETYSSSAFFLRTRKK